jgi:hypothetical protein
LEAVSRALEAKVLIVDNLKVELENERSAAQAAAAAAQSAARVAQSATRKAQLAVQSATQDMRSAEEAEASRVTGDKAAADALEVLTFPECLLKVH